MNGPRHYLKAEQLIIQANEWMDADHGWKAELSSEERIARRQADMAQAQVHATLALAAATAELERFGDDDGGASLGRYDRYSRAWGKAMDGEAV